MSFFKARKNAEDVKQGSNSNYITSSGMYPVEILAAFVNDNGKGSQTVDFFLDHEGQEQVLYGNLRITNNKGVENEIGSRIFNQLVVIAGLDDVSPPVEGLLPIGKDGEEKTVAVLEDFENVSVWIRVQMEYTVYNGDIKEKKVIKAFFGDDKASAEERVNGTEPGAAFVKEQEYANNITYKDGLTEEAISEWISANRPKGTANGGASKVAKAPAFSKKKRFGK